MANRKSTFFFIPLVSCTTQSCRRTSSVGKLMPQPTVLLHRRREGTLEGGTDSEKEASVKWEAAGRRWVSVSRWSCVTRRASWWNWTASYQAAVCFYLLFFFSSVKVSGRVWRKQQVVIVTVKQEQIVTGQGMVCLGACWLSRANSLHAVSFSGRLKFSFIVSA